MKVLSLEEIDELQRQLDASIDPIDIDCGIYNRLDNSLHAHARNYEYALVERCLFTAREYHRLKAALERISLHAPITADDVAREALKESE